ncbi:MAG: cofactor assembly of complex C subunit B [Thainema sp.]
MDSPVLASTFLLTLLLLVGLFFFIRASVKDRTESAQFVVDQPETEIAQQLQQHFQSRAYEVDPAAASETSSNASAVTLTGFVRPSLFLAIFLSLLAAIGFFCLALVVSLLLPSQFQWPFIFPLLAPLAGFFYWKGAARTETVQFSVQPSPTNRDRNLSESFVTVVAHRDEIIALQQALSLQKKEAES